MTDTVPFVNTLTYEDVECMLRDLAGSKGVDENAFSYNDVSDCDVISLSDDVESVSDNDSEDMFDNMIVIDSMPTSTTFVMESVRTHVSDLI